MAERTGIYVGTSGWSYPKGQGAWNGYFYPKGTRDELSFYSEFFNTVEVNTSFYHPLNPVYAANWARKTPKGFLFTVKLWQKFTHPAMFRAATGEAAVISSEDVEIFNQGIASLAEAGKLGAILAQFPPSFIDDEYGRQILTAVMRAFDRYPLAVELRHRSWSDDPDTAKRLAEGNAAWVQIDEPGFSFSIAKDLPLTSSLSYFRFHGRNKENWWNGNNETQYMYLYSPEEIKELSDKVSEAAARSKLTFAFFNNHWQGFAPKNAADLRRQLRLME